LILVNLKVKKHLLFGIDGMFVNCTSLSFINLSKFNLNRFSINHYEFSSGNFFDGLKIGGTLMYTEGLIPTKIQNVFPKGWNIIELKV